MKKKSFLKRGNPVTTVATVLLVTIALISSSSMSAALNKMIETKNLDLKEAGEKTSIAVEPSTGLAPEINQKNLISTSEKGNNLDSLGSDMSSVRGTTMYGYIPYTGSCYFDVDSSEDVTILSYQTIPNFVSGGTWTCDEKWLVCEYGNGALYEIDTETGNITEIGGGGVNLNGLAFDKITNLMYGAGDTSLYLVDMYTGTQEIVGPFGSDVWYMIGMAFDSNGVLYGWDLGDKLWTIDTATGDAAEVGPLGINLNYAQDGDFDRNNGDILYLTAFTLSPSYGPGLYICDKETGACTLVGFLPTEIDASMIKSECIPPEHDVGVTNISGPESGPAKTFPVNATIKNFGQNNECCFKTYVEIAELDVVSGLPLLEPEYEDFGCIGEIGAGEEKNLTFDDWTPAYLAEETSGTKIYSVKAWTDLNDPQDENPDNDLFTKTIELDFFHDVGIKEVTSLARSQNVGILAYVPIGTQNIEAITENVGTFPELDMTCYAEIYEYITNCTNGTLVYEDNITNIDIEQPLGGTETLAFDDYNFVTEGVYRLDLNLIDDKDDYPDNNQMTLGIGADDTPPTSTRTLSPANPDGDNGWYVSDVKVTLNAIDPTIGCDMDGSGVREIKYTISNGASGAIQGDHGTFKIHNDGNNIEVQYWSIDNVGNTEAKHTFYINMDQTKPVVPEAITGTFQKINGLWYVTFSANCTDALSGMDRVEWSLNHVVQNITMGPGPIYTWTIQWLKDFNKPNTTFKATAYDKAGNSDFVIIESSDIKSSPSSQSSSQQSLNNHNLLSSQFLFQQMVKTNK